jgi:general stress protein 26
MSEVKGDSQNEEPRTSRPQIPEYGIPVSEEGMLPWSHVCQRMEGAINYWIATTDTDGCPHATPMWGVWLDGTLYFDGSPRTRRGRNMEANPAIVVHLESGEDVVIIHGEAQQIRGLDDKELAVRLAETYSAKYASRGYEPTPDIWDTGGLYYLQPRVAFAWTKFPQDTTRFHFEDG